MALWCLDPYRPYVVGQVGFDQRMKTVMADGVPCGRCSACLANRKQDWTGRLVAEGLESAAVMFLTLTYAEEPDHFRYSDVQTFLKGLRKYVARKYPGGKVRFFCAGERGDVNGRIHWHLMLFFNRPVFIRARKKGEKWSLWDRGWAAIEMIPKGNEERLAKKCRYCVMYCLKGIDGADTPSARCSLGTSGDGPLGAAYFTRLAREIASNGHMPDGKYRFPSIRYDRGKLNGEMQTFTLRGAARDWFIRRWREAWSERYPLRAHWCNRWLLKYDREDADQSGLREEKGWIPAPAPIRRDVVRFPVIEIAKTPIWQSRFIVGPGYAVEISVSPEMPIGKITADDGMTWEFYESVSEILDIGRADIDKLDEWARMVRGPQWKGAQFDGECKEAQKAAGEERRVSIREHSRAEVVRLRHKHGVHSSAPGIYRDGYLAERDGKVAGPGNQNERETLALQGCYISPEDYEWRRLQGSETQRHNE